jgi:ribonuclease P protein component
VPGCYSLGKDERLRGNKRIEALFAEGKSFVAFPYRVIYLIREDGQQAPPKNKISLMVAVPKKRCRRAVLRNRIKRLTKEAYRLNKHCFHTDSLPASCSIDMVFIYLESKAPGFAQSSEAMLKTAETINLKTAEICSK